ncbi:MAG: hypothetical protein ABIV63_09795 [Caldimonas sp.]
MPQDPKKTGTDSTSDERVPTHRQGQTTPQAEDGRVHKGPHERDESSESQQGEPSELMRQAHDDIERGVTDTSRAEASDTTYAKELRDPELHAPDAPSKDGRK